MTCRICGKKVSVFESVVISNNITGGNMFSCHPSVLASDVSIDLFYCSDCQHMQFHNVLSEITYTNYGYTNSYKVSNYLTDIYDRQISSLVKKSRRGGLFVDIGCGAGYALEVAQKYFQNILGIEPSKQFSEVLSRKNIPLINDYFSKEILNEKGIKIDTFFSSQVFEHLDNPLSILQDIYDLCNENAVGIIEVPDGQLVWEKKDFWPLLNSEKRVLRPANYPDGPGRGWFRYNKDIRGQKYGCGCFWFKRKEI